MCFLSVARESTEYRDCRGDVQREQSYLHCSFSGQPAAQGCVSVPLLSAPPVLEPRLGRDARRRICFRIDATSNIPCPREMMQAERMIGGVAQSAPQRGARLVAGIEARSMGVVR